MKFLKSAINAIKAVAIFFGVFILYHIIFSQFFPADENNVLLAPKWYVPVGFAISGVSAVFFIRRRKKKQSKFFEKAQAELAEKKRKKAYDSLSEAEKWKLERESVTCSYRDLPIDVDPLTDEAAKIIFDTQQASVSMLQRRLRLNYERAAQVIDNLERIGVIGPFVGSAPRKILMSQESYSRRVRISNSRQIIATELEKRKPQEDLSGTDGQLSAVDEMEGLDFEKWCAKVLSGNGFCDVEVTRGSGDQGVDVLAVKDGIRYAIQCKCYSGKLSNKPVQEVNAGRVIYHCQIGAVMTNSYFTSGAKEAAQACGVLLWDRDVIKQMATNALIDSVSYLNS